MDIDQFYKSFPSHDDCIKHLEAVRWENGPVCPYCQSRRQTKIKGGIRYKCNNCNSSYSVTVGTIFHKTKCDMQKWFYAIYLFSHYRKGISSRQLATDINVTKDTAWYMLMRIRKSLKEDGILLESVIEIDETQIGVKNIITK